MGDPAPKGSRTYVAPGRSRPASKREKPWTLAVQDFAFLAKVQAELRAPMAPPYEVRLRFQIAPGKTKPKYAWPTANGDLDKLVRCTLDGLTFGGLIVDDRHVTRLQTEQHFVVGLAPAGCIVTVISLDPEAP